jgi:hypothetical protein
LNFCPVGSLRTKVSISHGIRYSGRGWSFDEAEAKEISLLLSEIGNWIMSRRKPLTKEERERVVRVVKAVVM